MMIAQIIAFLFIKNLLTEWILQNTQIKRYTLLYSLHYSYEVIQNYMIEYLILNSKSKIMLKIPFFWFKTKNFGLLKFEDFL